MSAPGGDLMRTPSLRDRVVSTGLAITTVLLLAFDAFVYLTLRAALDSTLDAVLEERVTTAEGLADLPSEDLAARLAASGIPAVVRSADGSVIEVEPATVRAGRAPPVDPGAVLEPRISRTVELPDGGEVEVLATRAGVEATLRRLLVVEAIGTAVALAVALAGLHRASAYALRPMDEVIATAHRTAAGRSGERLRPDRPDTEVGRMAASFDEMLDALEGALAEARASDDRSRRFLADAAHQLRTPVAGIRASVEALLGEEDPAVRDRLLGNVLRETARVGRIVTSLLRLARMDRGVPLALEPTDVVALCRQEVERAAELAPHLEVRLEIESAPAAPVLVDAPELHEALGNILDNARRHAATSITVGVSASGREVRIRVSDDGPGVAPGAAEVAFERFATLDGKGGSGLGLPIARGIARAHGGDVTYEDGAFTVSLPATTR